MKTRILCIAIFLCVQNFAYTQKVSDILENGVVVKEKGYIFLRLQNDKLFYEVGKKSSDNFDPVKESTFFLLHGEGINVYLAPPLNPLNFSSSAEITFTPDEINLKASEALGSIISALSKLATPASTPPTPAPTPAPTKGKTPIPVVVKILIDSTCIKKFLKIKADLENLAVLLKEDGRQDIIKTFTGLKSLDFTDREVTKKGLDDAKVSIEDVEKHYKDIADLIKLIKGEIDDFEKCTPQASDDFIKVFVMRQIVKDAQEVYQSYQKGLGNLKNVFSLVNKVYDNSAGTGKDWYILIGRVSMQDNKIASYKIALNSDGYYLSDDKEIAKSPKKEIANVTLKFRKFQRFIPEVSAGIAYTQLSFPKYATTTNSATGKLTVAEAGEDEFKKMNFTTMINFNYYIPNSSLHPFWQIGIGATAGYPTLLSGVGGRINLPSLKRLAFSVGLAGTWIKTLGSLKVGDPVSGDAELQNDLIYEFSFPLKPYLGLQYNF